MSTDGATIPYQSSSNRRAHFPPHPRSIASLGKRSRGYSYDNSSDGPCFSSDDLSEACLENYTSPRAKKQYRRSWWESDSKQTNSRHDSTSDTKDTSTQKPKDSGIFMASDNSSSNEDGFGLGLLSSRNLKRHSKRLAAFEDIQQQIASKTSHSVDPIANQIIEACLEADKEDVDLSRCSLATLSNETFRSLKHMIRRPNIDQQHHQVEAAFQPLTPQIKLFLSSNLLRLIPSEIVNIENLTVLSLRNNKLTELPQSFGRLKNLVELNVSGNKLTWLPWEIIQLCAKGKLHMMHVFPNPLFRPYTTSEKAVHTQAQETTTNNAFEGFIAAIEAKIEDLLSSSENDVLGERLAWKLLEQHELSTRIQHLHWRRGGRNNPDQLQDPEKMRPIQLGSTHTSLLSKDGTTPQCQPPSQMPRDSVLCLAPSHSAVQSRTNICTKIPSLYELALRTSSNHLIFTDIDAYLPENTPEHITRHLESARNASEVGAPSCSVCFRPYIVPRAEWIEYWQCTAQQAPLDELWLPFLRRTCSWGCANNVVLDKVSRLDSDRESFENAQIRVDVAKSALASGDLQSYLTTENSIE